MDNRPDIDYIEIPYSDLQVGDLVRPWDGEVDVWPPHRVKSIEHVPVQGTTAKVKQRIKVYLEGNSHACELSPDTLVRIEPRSQR